MKKSNFKENSAERANCGLNKLLFAAVITTILFATLSYPLLARSEEYKGKKSLGWPSSSEQTSVNILEHTNTELNGKHDFLDYSKAFLRLTTAFSDRKNKRGASSGFDIIDNMEPEDSERYARRIAESEAINGLQEMLEKSDLRGSYMAIKKTFEKTQRVVEYDPARSFTNKDYDITDQLPKISLGIAVQGKTGPQVKIGENSRLIYTPSNDTVMLEYGLNF